MPRSPVTEHPYPADLRSLTSLRIFLAIGVVLFHFQLQTDLSLGHSPIIERSRLAVDAFFMLSGFIMAHVYGLAVASGTFSYREFIVARVARLYPLHLVVLGGVLAMVFAAALMGVAFDSRTYSLQGFVGTLLLVNAWFPTDVIINWNGPAWSLSAEWFAYLAFPVFATLAVGLRRRPVTLLAIGVIAFILFDMAYRHLFGKILPRAEDAMGIMRVVPEFLIGMGLYGVGLKLKVGRFAAIMATLVSVGALLTAMHLSLDDRIVVALTAPVILSFSLLAKAGCEGLLASRPLVFAGEVSFALYLVHIPVLVAWKGLYSEWRGIDSTFSVGIPHLIGLFVATILISVVMHLLVEVPGRRWIRQRLAPSKTTPQLETSPIVGS